MQGVRVTKDVQFNGGVLEEGTICEVTNHIEMPSQTVLVVRPLKGQMSYAVDKESTEEVEIADGPMPD